MIVIFVAIMGLAHVAQRQSTGTESQVFTVLEQRTGLEKLVRQMRDATGFPDSSFNNGKRIRFKTPTRGIITIRCEDTTCTVTEDGVTRTVVRGLVNSELGQDVFCVRRGSHRGVRYASVRLLVRPPPRPGSNVLRPPIGLSGGASMRNFDGDPELIEGCE